MDTYTYSSYEEYLSTQVRTNAARILWTLQKRPIRLKDIANIQRHFDVKRVLCVGCGDDAEVDDFVARGFEAVGIDILPTTRQVRGDINKLEEKFKRASFELAYCSHSLEHTIDPLRVLRTIRSICTVGLYLVLPMKSKSAPDAYQPVLLEAMCSQDPSDLRELEPGSGEFQVPGLWERDDPNQPSGPEVAYALAWRS